MDTRCALHMTEGFSFRRYMMYIQHSDCIHPRDNDLPFIGGLYATHTPTVHSSDHKENAILWRDFSQ